MKVQITNAIMGAVTLWCSTYYPNNFFFNGILAGNFLLGSAFLTHDSCHRTASANHKTTSILSWFWGDVIFGVSTRWWKEEHDEHHSVTNTFDKVKKTFCDRQACEYFWCQSESIVGFFRGFYHPIVIRLQHYLALP